MFQDKPLTARNMPLQSCLCAGLAVVLFAEPLKAPKARLLTILKQTDMNFTEFDDVTVRRLVECIQVCGNKKIIVTLKGGYQAEEELRKIEVA